MNSWNSRGRSWCLLVNFLMVGGTYVLPGYRKHFLAPFCFDRTADLRQAPAHDFLVARTILLKKKFSTNIKNPGQFLWQKRYQWLYGYFPHFKWNKDRTQCWSRRGEQTSMKTSGEI